MTDLDEERTPEQSVVEWERVVAEIEGGYRLGLYDYDYDVWSRTLVHEGDLNTPLQSRLAVADERYRHTTFVPQPELFGRLWPGVAEGHSVAWHQCRLPKLLVGELAEDIGRIRGSNCS